LADTLESSELAIQDAPTQTQRFARGAGWLLTGNVAARGLGMVASIVAARIMGKENFGALGIILSTVATAGLFAGLGIGQTTTKYVAEYWREQPARAGRIVGMSMLTCLISSVLMGALLAIFAPWLATNSLNAPQLTNELRLSALLLVFNAMSGPVLGAIQGLEEFRMTMRITVITGILNLPIMILAVLYFGLPGAIIANIIAGALTWLFAQIFLRQQLRQRSIEISIRHLQPEMAVLWRFTLPAFLGGVLYSPVLWWANTILAHQPGGYGDLGLVNAANQWRNVLVFIPQVLGTAALPILSSAQGTAGATADYRTGVDLVQRVACFLVLPMYSFIFLAADSIMRLYGKGFEGSALVLGGVILGVCFQIMGNVIGTAIAARGKMWLGLLTNLVWASVLLCVLTMLAPQYGAQGYALAFVIAYAALLAVSHFLMRTELPAGTIKRTSYTALWLIVTTIIGLCLPLNWRLIIALPYSFVVLLAAVRILGFRTPMEALTRITRALRPAR
jgi:O-antigen/teichoic acid export membrane protein